MGLSSDGHCLPLADLLHLPPPRAERAGLMTRVRFVDRAVFTVSGVNQKWGIRKLRELPRSSVLMVQACWSLSDDSPEITPYSVGSRRCSSASSLNRPCGPALLGGGGGGGALRLWTQAQLAGRRPFASCSVGAASACGFPKGHVVTRGDGQDRWTPNTPKPSPALPQTQVPPPTADRAELPQISASNTSNNLS